MTELEDLLRAAYHARADLVTADQLTTDPSVAPEPVEMQEWRVAPPLRRRTTFQRMLPPLMAAAVVAALAFGGVYLASRPSHAPKPATPPAPTYRFTLPQATAWNGVGAGWTVALTVKKGATGQDNTYRLVLVDPAGHSRTITAVQSHAAEILGWSDNYQRVAMSTYEKSGASSVVIVNLADGTAGTTPLTGGERFIGFNAADGTTFDLLAADGTSVTVRTDDDAAASGVRPIHTVSMYDGSSVLAYLNGKPAEVSGGAVISVMIDGRRLVSVTSPATPCRPIRVWSATALLAQCRNGMWTVPVDGSAPTLVAKPDPGIRLKDGTMDYPYSVGNVVTVDGQLYAIEEPGCGSGDPIARIDAQGVPRQIGTVDGRPTVGSPTGVTDSAFYYLLINGGCQADGGTIYRYTPADSTVTTVLGGVASAVTAGQAYFPGD